jgi:uncharacterized cupin superfamily protein
MENLDRRDVFLGLAAMMAGIGSGSGQEANVLSTSQTYPFDQLPVKKNANGGISRAVVTGVLATGESVEVHETMLPPGQMPHPPHKHRNSEFVMIREGEVEFYHDGKTERVGPGGIMFNASNQMHGMKNIGTVDAQYFVVAIGRVKE